MKGRLYAIAVLIMLMAVMVSCRSSKNIDTPQNTSPAVSSSSNNNASLITEDNKINDDEKDGNKSKGNEIPSIEKTSSIVYKNTEYGFNFTLPDSWEGYKIINDKWEGNSNEENHTDKVVETGPMISIRHPKWTEQDKRQDIPIMVFTISQWNSLEQDKFHIGAAPVNPRELGRNNKYVFSLPARYNFAFPTGYEEVEKILESKPIKPVNK